MPGWKKCSLVGLLVLFVLVAVGCNNMLEPTARKSGGNTTDAGNGASYATIRVHDGMGRTILPEGYDFLRQGISFALVASREGTPVVSLGTWQDDGGTTAYSRMTADSFALSLEPGQWNFTLQASKQGVPGLERTISWAVVSGENKLDFGVMDVVSKGVGRVNVTLDLPKDNMAASVVAALYSLDGTTTVENTHKSIVTDFSQVKYSLESVPAGTYLLKMQLFCDTERKVSLNTYTELVRVVAGDTSSKDISLSKLTQLYSVTYSWGEAYTGSEPVPPVQYQGGVDGSVTLAATAVTDGNKVFSGWTDSLGNLYGAGTVYIPADNTVMTARWTTVDTNTRAVSSAGAAKVISGLAAGNYTILLTDTPTAEQLREIAAALAQQDAVDFTLDLSATTLKDLSLTKDTLLEKIVLPASCERVDPYSLNSRSFEVSPGNKHFSVVNDGEVLLSADSTTLVKWYITLKNAIGAVDASTLAWPEGITRIGASAFGNSALSGTVTIPATVTAIGEHSFPSTVTDFHTADNLYYWQRVYSSGTVEYLLSQKDFSEAMRGGTLEIVKLPEDGFMMQIMSLDGIGPHTVRLSTGDSLQETAVALAVLYERDSTVQVHLDLGGTALKTIPASVFKDKKNLVGVTLPDTCTRIELNAFSGAGLTGTLVIPPAVEYIAVNAFYYTSVSSVSTSSSWVDGSNSIGAAELHTHLTSGYEVYKITDLYTRILAMEQDGTIVFSDDDSLDIANVALSALYDLRPQVQVTLDFSATSMKEFPGRVFESRLNVAKVIIPASLTSISGRAFSFTSARFSVDPGNTTFCTLADGAILASRDGRELVCWPTATGSVEIPEGITTVRDGIFYTNKKITDVVFPASVSLIEEGAFYLCSKLSSVLFRDSNKLWVQSSDGCIVNSSSYVNTLTSGEGMCWATGTIASIVEMTSSGTIIGTAEDIDASQFSSALNVLHTNNPDVKVILDLSACTGMTEIPQYCFQSRINLEGIILPVSLTSIGSSAFKEASLTGHLVIPDSVETVGDYAFQNNAGLSSVAIGSKVVSFGYCAFAGTGLTNVDIPGNVTSVKTMLFDGCTALESVDIKGGLTEVGQNMFRNCTSLTYVRLPSTITYMNFCFWGCTDNSISMTLLAETPPKLDSMFSSSAFDPVKVVYVPAGSVEAYETAWADKISGKSGDFIQAISE